MASVPNVAGVDQCRIRICSWFGARVRLSQEKEYGATEVSSIVRKNTVYVLDW